MAVIGALKLSREAYPAATAGIVYVLAIKVSDIYRKLNNNAYIGLLGY